MRWTDEANATLEELYTNDVPVSVIADRFKCSLRAVYSQAHRLGLSEKSRQQRAVKSIDQRHRAYNNGRKRRSDNGTKNPPMEDAVLRAWFLAGWHDKDIEMGVSVL